MKLPRYRLLTLFIAIGVVAVVLRVVLAWIDRAERTYQRVRTLQESAADRSEVSTPEAYFEFDDSPVPGGPVAAAPGTAPRADRPLADYLWHSVVGLTVTELTRDEDLEGICEFTTLEQLIIQRCQFSPAAWRRLTALKKLHYLCVVETELDDKDVREVLAALPRLEVLHLNQPGLSEEGLRQMSALKHLSELCLVLDWEFYGGREQNQSELERLLPQCRVHLLEPRSTRFWQFVGVARSSR
jgi:hypothetical protein